jgi:hypothetical protein
MYITQCHQEVLNLIYFNTYSSIVTVRAMLGVLYFCHCFLHALSKFDMQLIAPSNVVHFSEVKRASLPLVT